jgi:hypothetical protein
VVSAIPFAALLLACALLEEFPQQLTVLVPQI